MPLARDILTRNEKTDISASDILAKHPVDFSDYRLPQPADITRVDPSFAEIDRRPIIEGMIQDLEKFTGAPKSQYEKPVVIDSKFKGMFGMRVPLEQPLTPEQQKYTEQTPVEQAGGQLLRAAGRFGLGAVGFLTDIPGKLVNPGDYVEGDGSYWDNLWKLLKQEGTGLREMTGDFIPTVDFLIRRLGGNLDPSADIWRNSPVTRLAELIAGKPMTQENYQEAINRFYEAPETPLFVQAIGTGLARGGLKAGRAIAPKIGRKVRAQPLEHRGFTEQPLPEPGTKRIEADYQTEGLKPIETRPVEVAPTVKPPVALLAGEKSPVPAMPTVGGGLIPSEVVTKAADATRKAMITITEATSEIIQKAKTPPIIKEGVIQAREVMIEHDRQIRRAESTASLFKKTIEDAVPTDSRQMLMLHAFEQGKGSKHWRQLNGTERDLVNWALREKSKLDRYIDEHKVLDRLKMPEGMHHISHWWNDPKTGKPFAFKYGKTSKATPLAKQRTIPTFEAGIAKGMTPATTNLGEIIGQSWESVVRAQQSREMFKTLHNVGAAVEGTIQLTKGGKLKPIRMVERWDKLKKQGLEDGYVRYSHEALDKPLAFKSADGTLVQLKGAVGVRKELYPFVQAYLENPKYNTFDQLNFATKSLKLGVSLFHVMSLGAQEIANFRVPFVNIGRGLKLRKDLGPTVRLLHQEGLEVLKGYEDLGYRNSFFEGANLGGKIGNVALVPVTKMRDFIFNVVQPGMKTSFAVDMYNKLLPKYMEKGLTKEQLARDVVKKADGHFSGEHYKRALLETNRFMVKSYFSPEMRRWWQRMLLSPTWQREHLLVAKNVTKSFMPDKFIKKLGLEEIGPIKSQYRRYALGGIMMVGAADLYNYMTTLQMDGEGKHLWENPKGKGFAIRARWDEPDYKTTDKNGKTRTIKGGSGYIRPLKSVFEIAEWFAKPADKLSYKLSPAMSALLAQFPVGAGFGSRYEGWDLPKRTKDFLFDVATPITVNQFTDWYKGRKSTPGAVLPFFGMPTSKVKRRDFYAERREILDLFLKGDKKEANQRILLWNKNPKNIPFTDKYINPEVVKRRAEALALTEAKKKENE